MRNIFQATVAEIQFGTTFEVGVKTLVKRCLMRETGIAMAWVILGTIGCLYTQDIGAPPRENTPPYFTNWLPTEGDVWVETSGTPFYVYYVDDDPEDVGRLEMQWYLNGRDQGNGNQTWVYPEDLGPEGTGVLVAHVKDPQDTTDSRVWRLEVVPEISEGE